jgi:hypothetical protein
MEAATRHLKAFLWLAGLIGAISTVAGIFKGNAVYILTAAGYVGIASMLPAAILYNLVEGGKYEILAAIGSVGFGLVCLLVFGLRDEEVADFNALSVVGIIVIVVLFSYGVHVFTEWQKYQAPARKTCPDCANQVLAAAQVCQYCHHRF